MELGDGFTAALKEEMGEGSGELAKMFGTLFDQAVEKLYRRLREDIIAEVRAEVQRTEAAENRLADALCNMASPVVNVAPATVQPQILAGDVEVTVPKAPAPKVTIEPRKHIELIRNAEGQIMGAEVS